MQTFLICNNFSESAKSLDSKRLFKQCVEAKQIYQALTEETSWSNHPAVKMWKKHKDELIVYGQKHCIECLNREINAQNLKDFFDSIYPKKDMFQMNIHWITYDLMISHKSNLLHKNYEFYRMLPGWEVVPQDLLYVWPSYYDKDGRIKDTGAASLYKTLKKRVNITSKDSYNSALEKAKSYSFLHNGMWLSCAFLIDWKSEGLI